jgi:teichoic acid transport system permease protein
VATASPSTTGLRRAYLRRLWRRRDFTVQLALGNVAAQTAATRLGILWWVINPLLLSLIYFVVFGVILGGRRGNPEFLAYLVIGVFAFRFLSQTMTKSANLITGNSKLITSVRMPRLLFPIAATIESVVGFGVGLAVFFGLVMPFRGITPTWWTLLLPVPLALQFLFSMGIGALTARFVVRVRDVANLVPHFTRLWFYLSPVLWPLDRLSLLYESELDFLLPVLYANPMFAILSLYRTALLGPDLAPFEPLMLASAVTWTTYMLIIGTRSFVRHEEDLARYL